MEKKILMFVLLLLLFVISGCGQQAAENMKNQQADAPKKEEMKNEEFYLLKQKHTIQILESWSLTTASRDEINFELDDRLIGGLYIIGNYDQQTSKQSQVISSKLGEGTLYIIESSNDAADLEKQKHYEIHVYFPNKDDKGLTYKFWFQPLEEPSEQFIQQIKEIVETFDITGEKEPMKPYTYTNQQYNFEFTIPADWEDKFVIADFEPGTEVFYLPTEEKNSELNGFLFSIVVYDEAEWENEKDQPGAGTEIVTTDSKVYTYMTAIEVPYEEGVDQNEYIKMNEDIKSIIDTFKILN